MLVKDTTVIARSGRKSYTLVELLVAMAIIAFLAGLLILMWPGLNSSSQSTRNADSIQGMLLSAKMLAIRDGVPTGVRLVLTNPLDPYSPSKQLMYIRQPNPFTPPVTTNNGVVTVGTLQTAQPGPPAVLTFTGVDFTGGQSVPTDYLVQGAGTSAYGGASALGDYLEFNGGGPLHTIIFVTPTSLVVKDTITLVNPTTNWRVVRNPRPLAGEEPLDLSGTAIIDAGDSIRRTFRTRVVTDGNRRRRCTTATSCSRRRAASSVREHPAMTRSFFMCATAARPTRRLARRS